MLSSTKTTAMGFLYKGRSSAFHVDLEDVVRGD